MAGTVGHHVAHLAGSRAVPGRVAVPACAGFAAMRTALIAQQNQLPSPSPSQAPAREQLDREGAMPASTLGGQQGDRVGDSLVY